ncbi:MAG TPA: pyridoxamine 5'-phosphate oxidase family protein [Candidatus Eisenbacteria bacterium]|nr:pyridoxamine 5'-phosphate oxidase family protein [Candidatus Eisenbacteria bacterium]
MDQKVINFLTKHRVGALTVVNINGTPHAAVVHYAHTTDPLRIYILTEKSSKKAQGLLLGETQRAAFVVGFSEEEWVTFQAEGNIKMVLGEKALQDAQAIYYLKFPNAKHITTNSNLILLEFTTTWWRYSNLNPSPWEVIASHQEQ